MSAHRWNNLVERTRRLREQGLDDIEIQERLGLDATTISDVYDTIADEDSMSFVENRVTRAWYGETPVGHRLAGDYDDR